MIKINDMVIEQNHFPDGTQLIKYIPVPNIIGTYDYQIIWKYENDSELFTLICLTKHIREHEPNATISFQLPYLPNARQDRVKSANDTFTLKYFCEIINSLNFNEVLVTDVHSNVGLALLDRVGEIKPWDYINRAIHKIPVDRELVLFYPDEGAMKRYSSALNLPFAFGVKRRNWETGVIEGLDLMGNVEAINGRDVLIIDDICSKGGTFYYSAKALKEAGAANIYLYVTHCENTIHEGELLKKDSLIKEIFTTDSILTKTHEKITIVN